MSDAILAPLPVELRHLERQLHGMIEGGELRRLPQPSLNRLRAIQMRIDRCADVAADQPLRHSRERKPKWWRVF